MIGVTPLLRDLFNAIGIGGVSVVGVVALTSMAIWLRRLSRAGSAAAGLASVGVTHLQVIAVGIAVLAIAGVISLNPARASELGQMVVDAVARSVSVEPSKILP